MSDEFVERCEKAIKTLEMLELGSSEANSKRLRGKIEGVKLALSFYLETPTPTPPDGEKGE